MSLSVARYWEARYRAGKHGSGSGSRGAEARHKAEFVNALIREHRVRRVIDWGCGDGIVARLFHVQQYVGLDISQKAVSLCAAHTPSPHWSFLYFDGLTPPPLQPGDLALSLDVIFHLVDDKLYHAHLAQLFGSAPLVVVHSSNRDEAGLAHVLHRTFARDVPEDWEILRRPDDEATLGFWVFRKVAS